MLLEYFCILMLISFPLVTLMDGGRRISTLSPVMPVLRLSKGDWIITHEKLKLSFITRRNWKYSHSPIFIASYFYSSSSGPGFVLTWRFKFVWEQLEVEIENRKERWDLTRKQVAEV